MYHRVMPGGAPPDWPLRSLVIDTDEFAKQVDWLAQRFEMCTAFDAVCSERRGTRPRAAITFDDGYRDNFEHAAPILSARGVPATFFISSRFIGSRRRMWFEVAAAAWMRMRAAGNDIPLGNWMNRLKRLPPAERDSAIAECAGEGDWVSPERDAAMTWDEVADLQSAGHEIGCHSRTHPILPLLTDDELRDEIGGCLEDLRDHGIHAHGIAYPNGDFDERVIRSVQEAGLKYGVSTRMGWHRTGSSTFDVRRVDVNPARVRRWSDDAARGFATEIAWQRLTAVRA